MTEKQEETCENCGFREELHPVVYCRIEGLRRKDKECKKFKAKKTDKKTDKNHSPQHKIGLKRREDTPSDAEDTSEGTFNLSDCTKGYRRRNVINTEDVKEFIRRLKEHFKAPKGRFGSSINEFIDELAGDELSK